MTAPPITRDDEPALSRPIRWLLNGVAAVSLFLAVVGAVLPIMPTVPFVLVAAWAATKSSPRLARWLESQPRLGPSIREWRQGGVVRRPVKWVTTATMSGGGAFMIAFVQPWWVPAAGVPVMVVVAVWIWLRPEQASPGK
jgi:uncharacterized protein